MLKPIAHRISRDERGIAATEYALIASLIAVAAAGAFASLGSEVGSHYDGIDAAVRGADGQG